MLQLALSEGDGEHGILNLEGDRSVVFLHSTRDEREKTSRESHALGRMYTPR